MYLPTDFERWVTAYELARVIRQASWLGKRAANARSRALAYAVKGQKLSTALLSFAEHFRLLQAEHHSHYGVLLLIGLPTGYRAHVPLDALTPQAQARVRWRVNALLAATADEESYDYEDLPRAA